MSDSSWDMFAVLAHSLLCDLYVGVTSWAVIWTETRAPHKGLAVGLYMHTIAQSVLTLKALPLHILILLYFCKFQKTNASLVQLVFSRDKQQIFIWFFTVFEYVSCVPEKFWYHMLERKTQNLPRPAIKANLFLLFVSPLSFFLFNNWIHTLEDLNLTMNTPLVVEHVPFF